jgi:hypothetical protein
MLRVQLLEEQLISRPENCFETRDKEMGYNLQQRFLNCVPTAHLRVAVAQLLEALCYKPQGSIPKKSLEFFTDSIFGGPVASVRKSL